MRSEDLTKSTKTEMRALGITPSGNMQWVTFSASFFGFETVGQFASSPDWQQRLMKALADLGLRGA
jgi:hypothetical protein